MDKHRLFSSDVKRAIVVGAGVLMGVIIFTSTVQAATVKHDELKLLPIIKTPHTKSKGATLLIGQLPKKRISKSTHSVTHSPVITAKTKKKSLLGSASVKHPIIHLAQHSPAKKDDKLRVTHKPKSSHGPVKHAVIHHKPLPAKLNHKAKPKSLPKHVVNKPNTYMMIPLPKVIHIAEQAALSSYTYDHRNYHHKLKKASSYFSREGWKAFSKALDQSNNLNLVKKERIVVSAKLNGKSKIIKQRLLHGQHAWYVRVPVKVTYRSPSQHLSQVLDVDITLVREPKHLRGIAVGDFIAKLSRHT